VKVLETLRRARNVAEPLPEIRPTSEILADIDQQVGRLTMVRDRALEIIDKIEEQDDVAPE
jgi:hypothetical protein